MRWNRGNFIRRDNRDPRPSSLIKLYLMISIPLNIVIFNDYLTCNDSHLLIFFRSISLFSDKDWRSIFQLFSDRLHFFHFQFNSRYRYRLTNLQIYSFYKHPQINRIENRASYVAITTNLYFYSMLIYRLFLRCSPLSP